MSDNRREEAIDVIARRILRHGVYSGRLPHHDDYPGMSTAVWEDITARVIALVEQVSSTSEEFEAAYEYLVRNP